MASLQRFVVSPVLPRVPPGLLWRGVLAVAAVTTLFTSRACEFDLGTAARYVAYFGAYVVLPGMVAMRFVNRGALALTQVLALAVPTGFALEIFSFLGLAASGAKPLYAWLPAIWLALGVWQWRGARAWPVRVRLAGNHAGVCFALGLVFLGTAVMAASQMFAESPLASGLPTRAIFHDWVYLVSRAGVIKHNWPLDDPSLSGTPLQYHYFMMVHAAAASWTTGVEISTVMLRLVFVPLGAVLVAQAFALGRAVSRSAWGGVLAAGLTVAASEMSFAPSYGEPMFLGLFVRWLFVSPTFFFGMIYCGALLLAIGRGVRRGRSGMRDYLWLAMLGAAGTGAKGTLLPVILCALTLWALWRWGTERRLPWGIVGYAAVLGLAFAAVYLPTMWAWRTGDARLRPFHVFQLTQFWKHTLPIWQAWCAQRLPAGIAGAVATTGCALVVFAGTCGVRLLALPYLCWRGLKQRDAILAGWLGAFFVAAAGMGLLLELNSYGELYVILMMRLPMAVLTAAFVIAAMRRLAPVSRRFIRRAGMRVSLGARLERALVFAVMGLAVAALGVQSSLWWTRNRTGLREWLATPLDLKPDDYMGKLEEALLWIRGNTEPDAVLVANACTPENMRKDHWGALDRTLTGVHFYYSALAERRLWFEGPNYILDTTRARIRANLASNFFYRGRPLDPRVVSEGPCYALIDRSLADGASVDRRAGRRVFANDRLEVYELTRFAGATGAHVASNRGSDAAP